MKSDQNRQRNFAIIVSAGSGQRFGQTPPKQFAEINGMTVLGLSVDRFSSSFNFDGVVVAGPPDYMSKTSDILSRFLNDDRHSLIEGGGSRVESIQLLLLAIEDSYKLEDNDTITLFDANRPLTTRSVIVETIITAQRVGGACPVVEVVNGVAVLDDDLQIVQIPKRHKVVSILTPESVRWGEIKIIKDSLSPDGPYSGFAELLLGHNKPFGTVKGDKYSLKITNPEDWALFRILFEESENYDI